jgi:hypothetical protein
MPQPLPSLTSEFFSRNDIQEKIAIAKGFALLNLKVDMDVYLPTRGCNLQRELCWTLEQNQALIESVIVRRLVPPISVIYTHKDIYEIIDGKQRFNALLSYLLDQFEFCGYKCSELPSEYLGQIKRFHLEANRLLPKIDPEEAPISDDAKVEWFRFLNFTGTPQDERHLAKLDGQLDQKGYFEIPDYVSLSDVIRPIVEQFQSYLLHEISEEEFLERLYRIKESSLRYELQRNFNLDSVEFFKLTFNMRWEQLPSRIRRYVRSRGLLITDEDIGWLTGKLFKAEVI